jgi:hypothetical protein
MEKGGLSTRRIFLFTALAAPVVHGLAVESLRVRADGAFLHVAAPHLQFLSGRPLQRLRNGATVIFLFQLSMSTDRFTTVAHRSFERFAFSYDLWEEKFAVTRLGTARLATSHLDSGHAQTWCLSQVALPADGVNREQPVWMRMEVRVDESKFSPLVFSSPPLSLNRLIEIFSRPASSGLERWTAEAGPLKIAELNR